MYTQNISFKNSCENAEYKEFPNRNAIRQMQLIQNSQNSTETNQKQESSKQVTKNITCNNEKCSEILMPIILSLIFSDCNIDDNDIFTILLCGILTL